MRAVAKLIVHTLDQQRDNSRLLDREELVPQRVDLLQSRTGVGLGDVVGVGARRLPRPGHDLGLAEHSTHLVNNCGLDLPRWHAADGAGSSAMLQHRLTDVVAVQPPALAGVRRRECRAVGSEQQAPQQRGRLGAGAGGAFSRAFLQDGVDTVPCLAVDDCRMLAGITGPLVDCLTDVDPVVQHPVDEFLIDAVAPAGCDAPLCQFARQQCARPDLDEAGEDPAHMRSIGRVFDQLPVLYLISKWRAAAHPHALHSAGADLVADAFRRHLPFELGEGQ